MSLKTLFILFVNFNLRIHYVKKMKLHVAITTDSSLSFCSGVFDKN